MEIHNAVVYLNDSAFRVILMVSSNVLPNLISSKLWMLVELFNEDFAIIKIYRHEKVIISLMQKSMQKKPIIIRIG